MAWRIDEYLIRGEIDSRVKGRVTGTLYFEGLDHPVRLDLKGNPWRDLAGHRLSFVNPRPKPGLPEGLSAFQFGAVGDITASRKVRVPDCSMEEFLEAYKQRRQVTYHMGNSLYLEWYSQSNGRVVIESADYTLQLDSESAWTMTASEEIAQRLENERAIETFMGRLAQAMEEIDRSGTVDPRVNDAPTSPEEAEADEHDARMQQLLDRIDARLSRESETPDEATMDRIMEEERERLRQARGEPPPAPLTPEQEADQAAWIEEMNRISREALEASAEEMDDFLDRERHPLAELCHNLAIRLHHDLKDHGWITDHDPAEHPLHEICNGVTSASAKLAGALNGTFHDGQWPPDRLFAGDTLVRLKKARRYLYDAQVGLDAADDDALATPEWRSQVRIEVNAIMDGVEQAIRDVRTSLEP